MRGCAVMVGVLIGTLGGAVLASRAGRELSDAPARKRAWVQQALITGACCGALVARFGVGWTTLPYVPLGVLGPALGAIDRATQRLPDRWIGTLATASTLGMAAVLLATRPPDALGTIITTTCGAALLSGGFLALALARPGALGLGDVKLAAVLGGCLAWRGPAKLADGTAAGLALAAGAGALTLLRGGRRDTRLALGPHLLAGAFLALLA